MSLAAQDFVYGQDGKTSIVGLPELFFPELMIDGFDCFPVQSQIAGDLLDGHELAKLEPISRQSFGRPQIGVEKNQHFEGSLPAMRTDDFPVLAVDPKSGWPEIRVAYLASLLTGNSICSLSADIAKGTKPIIWPRLQVSFPGIAGNLRVENTDLRQGEIM